MIMKDPSNHSQWIEAARQRALDAKNLLLRTEQERKESGYTEDALEMAPNPQTPP
ncbi:MAG: hypothetical protein HQK65_13850 [Desulfamplus sp.]|nr:hypothetical protein [Desulfamplus sp.]